MLVVVAGGKCPKGVRGEFPFPNMLLRSLRTKNTFSGRYPRINLFQVKFALDRPVWVGVTGDDTANRKPELSNFGHYAGKT